MIWLSSDCLVFQMANGESVPFSAEMISVELMGDAAGKLQPEVVQHAAASVFHYFKNDLHRDSVTVGEFAGALETVLRGLGFSVETDPGEPRRDPAQALADDLRVIACGANTGCELVFFPRLRDALRGQLEQSPRLVRFRGLRGCVKQLAGARRWSPRCESLRDQIVEYLRQCLTAEHRDEGCSLLVE